METSARPVLRRRSEPRPSRARGHGEPDAGRTVDDRPIAAFLTTLEIPAGGEQTVVVILGQADDRRAGEGGRRASIGMSTTRRPPRGDPAMVAGPDGDGPGPDDATRSSTATSTG